jgi:hypothetical protein
MEPATHADGLVFDSGVTAARPVASGEARMLHPVKVRQFQFSARPEQQTAEQAAGLFHWLPVLSKPHALLCSNGECRGQRLAFHSFDFQEQKPPFRH